MAGNLDEVTDHNFTPYNAWDGHRVLYDYSRDPQGLPSKDLEPKVFASVGQCALFRALKPEQLPQLVKVAELQRFDPGEAIVKQGAEQVFRSTMLRIVE